VKDFLPGASIGPGHRGNLENKEKVKSMRSTLRVLLLACAVIPVQIEAAARNLFAHELVGCFRESSGRVVCRVAITHESDKAEPYPPHSRSTGRLIVNREHKSYDFDIEGPSGERGLTRVRLAPIKTFHVLWFFQDIPTNATEVKFQILGMPKGPVKIEIVPDKPGGGRGRR
jgi:hypothetical protein